MTVSSQSKVELRLNVPLSFANVAELQSRTTLPTAGSAPAQATSASMTAAFNLIDSKSVKVGGSDDLTHGC